MVVRIGVVGSVVVLTVVVSAVEVKYVKVEILLIDNENYGWYDYLL